MSPRQREVVALVRDGLTYRQIGAQLQISPYTVRAHVVDIFDKHGIEGVAPLRWIAANAARLLAA